MSHLYHFNLFNGFLSCYDRFLHVVPYYRCLRIASGKYFITLNLSPCLDETESVVKQKFMQQFRL